MAEGAQSQSLQACLPAWFNYGSQQFLEVAIHRNSGFRRFRDRLDAKLRRRESIEYLKRQHGRKFTSMIHPETPVIERCPICHESQTKILMDPGPVGDRVLSLPLASLICVPLRNLRTRIRDVISNRIWDLRCWPVDHFWLTVPGGVETGAQLVIDSSCVPVSAHTSRFLLTGGPLSGPIDDAWPDRFL